MFTTLAITPVSVLATGWTALNLVGGSDSDSVLIQCRTAVDVLLGASGSPGANYFTLKSGSTLELNTKGLGAAFLYAQSTSGTVIVELMEIKKRM